MAGTASEDTAVPAPGFLCANRPYGDFQVGGMHSETVSYFLFGTALAGPDSEGLKQLQDGLEASTLPEV